MKKPFLKVNDGKCHWITSSIKKPAKPKQTLCENFFKIWSFKNKTKYKKNYKNQ